MLNLFSLTTCCHFIVFRDYICSVLNGNELCIEYSLECCLEGKKTLNVPLTYFKGNNIWIGFMSIKVEYLTQNERTLKRKGHLFKDYKLGHFLNQYRNLLVKTSNYKQCQGTHQSYDTSYIAMRMIN